MPPTAIGSRKRSTPTAAASISRATIRNSDLSEQLEALRAEAERGRRLSRDPVELVRAFATPGEVEVVGLICASLAYGRVDLFKPVLRRWLALLGPSPRQAALALRAAVSPAVEDFRALTYRFNLGADLACLTFAIGDALATFGSLETLFLTQLQSSGGELRGALAGFASWLRGRDFGAIVARLGPPRALHHLLPDPARNGASKRLLLYLRWMVRGPDAVDVGAWTGLSPAQLLIPVDTHVARMARNLGLTRRRDLSWRTAQEITESLRGLDPNDPVKYDFALCHFGMSGACPPVRRLGRCRECGLLGVCGNGQRILRLHG